MKVTYNWLEDFVDIRISPQALADRLSMAGLEVGSIEEKEGDFVFEIEITSNRPDWLNVIGIAREIAAITNSKLKIQNSKFSLSAALAGKTKLLKEKIPFNIEIEDKKDCPLYTAKVIKGVKVAPPPAWLKKRLELIGCRSVNNIVDITNYILFTWGEPLHAFDLDKLSSRSNIIIRRARAGEDIVTIDGIKRPLDKSVLIIASGAKGEAGIPAAIAGIMGGKETEITQATKNVLLEAAVFDPVIIRRSRQKLGIQTDSSYRFERGVDFGTVKDSSLEAVKLIYSAAGGDYSLSKESGLPRTKNRAVTLEAATISKILGIEINAQKIRGILTGLGFKLKSLPGKKNLVSVPSFRQDIKSDIDLIEEIARVFGYEAIPKTLPAFYPKVTALKQRTFIPAIKNILVGLGLDEVITYSMIDKQTLQGWGKYHAKPLEILNPLSREQEILRPTMLPSLIKCVAFNLNQKQELIRIFEIAKTFFYTENGETEESPVLGIALCGIDVLLLEQGVVRDNLGLLHLKGILEALFERLGIKDYGFCITDSPGAIDVYVAKQKAGLLLQPQNSLLDEFDIKNKNVAAAELYLNKVFPFVQEKKKFTALPLYPGISRDLSFVIKDDIKIDDVLAALKQNAGNLLRSVNVSDYYRGKQIPPGFKGLTLTCFYRADERTLADAEVNPLHSAACQTLVDKFGIKIR